MASKKAESTGNQQQTDSSSSLPKNAKGFPPGKSGNPAGRPKGSRNKATLLAEALLDGESEKVTRKCIELALSGDTTAMKLCMDRLVPPRKYRSVQLKLPEIREPHDLLAAHDAVLSSVADGSIAPEEAAVIASLLEGKRKAFETIQLADDVELLKERVGTT